MRIRFALVTACLLAATGCVLPARSYGAYEEKTATTARAVLSAVEDARLALRTAAEGRGTSAFITVTLAESEDDATSAESTLASIQPPDERSLALSDALDLILVRAVKTLTTLRIEARGGRMTALPKSDAALEAASNDLNAFLRAHG